ncbi:hypothetical protein L1887_15354 [Cichorium endivia]|nr:hypothetical protein L1887_15354 [Cichorium endivia]
MAGKTYVTKGYSTYTDIPTRGGYDQGPHNPVNQYAVQTKTIERVRAPTNFVGSPSRIELLNEYVHSPTMSSSPNASYFPNTGHNYRNSSPPKFHDEGSWAMKTRDFSSPKKHRPSSPVHGYHSEESHQVHSGPGFVGARQIKTGNNYGPNRSWESSGPPMTNHPLTTSTNNINEALGFLESASHSPRSGPRQRGVLDELSTRAQPLEPQKRYARPAFVAKPNDIYTRHY